MSDSRVARLIANCRDVDAIVILNDGEPYLDSTFWYLTEQSGGCFEGSYAVVNSDGELHVMTGSLEAETAASGKGNVHIHRTRDELIENIRSSLNGAKRIGINGHSATYAMVQGILKIVPDAEIVDVGSGISDTVAIKDEKEIEATRKACAISSKVAQEIPEMLREGMTEREMASMIDNRMRELGGSGNAFDTIAAFGENASQPHYMPGDRKLRKGDVALFDFGTKYARYCSDMTRTVFFGEPPEVLKRAYKVVKEAQQKGFETYRDGAGAAEADIVARGLIDSTEFKGRFIHTFGHGIGMEVHQDISVYAKSQQILRAGNVISAEPGIYLPGIGGIRIEDTCLVKKDCAERLTSFDHELTIV